jgi:3-oxoadipate enol-lactonase
VLEATALEWRASLRERFTWRFLAVLELGLRLGPSEGFVERWLRRAVEESPELAPWRGWLKGEIRRGDPGAIADAGRALSRYDARPFAGSVDVPTTVVITTADRLVRPRKQRALAKAIPAAFVVSINADHDAPLVRPEALRLGTEQAVRSVLDRLPMVTSVAG